VHPITRDFIEYVEKTGHRIALSPRQTSYMWKTYLGLTSNHKRATSNHKRARLQEKHVKGDKQYVR